MPIIPVTYHIEGLFKFRFIIVRSGLKSMHLILNLYIPIYRNYLLSKKNKISNLLFGKIIYVIRKIIQNYI